VSATDAIRRRQYTTVSLYHKGYIQLTRNHKGYIQLTRTWELCHHKAAPPVPGLSRAPAGDKAETELRCAYPNIQHIGTDWIGREKLETVREQILSALDYVQQALAEFDN
jgi:hypothetical protein